MPATAPFASVLPPLKLPVSPVAPAAEGRRRVLGGLVGGTALPAAPGIALPALSSASRLQASKSRWVGARPLPIWAVAAPARRVRSAPVTTSGVDFMVERDGSSRVPGRQTRNPKSAFYKTRDQSCECVTT